MCWRSDGPAGHWQELQSRHVFCPRLWVAVSHLLDHRFCVEGQRLVEQALDSWPHFTRSVASRPLSLPWWTGGDSSVFRLRLSGSCGFCQSHCSHTSSHAFGGAFVVLPAATFPTENQLGEGQEVRPGPGVLEVTPVKAARRQRIHASWAAFMS